MTWERRLLDLFDDLEQRAEGLAMVERDAEVSELARAQYGEVDLGSRLHGSVGRRLELAVQGLGPLRGALSGVGAGWCVIAADAADGGGEWAVVTSALLGVRGLSAGARTEQARPPASRLSVGSLLRRLAEERERVVLVRRDGERRSGTPGRVGADFVELVSPDGEVEVVPLAAIAGLRRPR